MFAFTMTFQQSGIPVLDVCIHVKVAEIQVVISILSSFQKRKLAGRFMFLVFERVTKIKLHFSF